MNVSRPPAPVSLLVKRVSPIPCENAAPSSSTPLPKIFARPVARAGMIAATALTLLTLSFGVSSLPAAADVEPAVPPAASPAEIFATSPVSDTGAEPIWLTSVVPKVLETDPPEAADALLPVLRPANSRRDCPDTILMMGFEGHPRALELAWDIRGGRVANLTILSNTMDPTTQECLLQAVRALRFPADLNVHVQRARWILLRDRVAEKVLPVRTFGGY